MRVLFPFLISLVVYSVQAVNLDDRTQAFVLETQKIEIPGHPNAFNPSIVHWRGELLISFRELPLPDEAFPCSIQSSSLSGIGLQFLHEDFSLDGEAHMLKLPGCLVNGKLESRAEDARLFTIDGRLYILYSDNLNEIITEGGFRMLVGELDFNGKNFFLKSLELINNFPGQSPKLREKNWVPFDYKGAMMLAYHIKPHIIFYPNLDGSGSAEDFATTASNVNWKWGELRGGTPALRMGNQYLSFFHSCIETVTEHSKGEKILHYFMGAYTFEKHPPFQLTQISQNPIFGKKFYEGKEYVYYWKPVRVVFPCGFIYDNEYIWVSYGRQDHEIWIVKLDRQGLLESLIPIEQPSCKYPLK